MLFKRKKKSSGVRVPIIRGGESLTEENEQGIDVGTLLCTCWQMKPPANAAAETGVHVCLTFRPAHWLSTQQAVNVNTSAGGHERREVEAGAATQTRMSENRRCAAASTTWSDLGGLSNWRKRVRRKIDGC